MLGERLDGVGQLDLAAAAGRGLAQDLEDGRREQVAADDREVARRLLERRLLDQVADPHDGRTARRLGAGSTVATPYSETISGGTSISAMTLPPCVCLLGEHRLEQRVALVDHVVAEHDDERLVADVLGRHEHRVAEPGRDALADEMDLGELGRRADPGAAARASPFFSSAASISGALSKWSSIAPLPRAVMMRTSVRPARAASSTMYSSAGLSTTGSSSFGTALVAGRKRVPRPAAGMTALVTGFGVEGTSWANLSRRGVPNPAPVACDGRPGPSGPSAPAGSGARPAQRRARAGDAAAGAQRAAPRAGRGRAPDRRPCSGSPRARRRSPPTSRSAPSPRPIDVLAAWLARGTRVLLPVVLPDRDLEFRRLRRRAGDRAARAWPARRRLRRSCRWPRRRSSWCRRWPATGREPAGPRRRLLRPGAAARRARGADRRRGAPRGTVADGADRRHDQRVRAVLAGDELVRCA